MRPRIYYDRYMQSSKNFMGSFNNVLIKSIAKNSKLKIYKIRTEVEIVFFPSVARIRHLYSIASPAVVNLFLCTLDLKDAKKGSTTRDIQTKISFWIYKPKTFTLPNQ